MPGVTPNGLPTLLPSTPLYQEEKAPAAVSFGIRPPFDLIRELETNRNAYRVPDSGIHLKLKSFPSWCKSAIKSLCEMVSLGPFGKRPGIQPACAACIAHGLDIVEAWPEAKELILAERRRRTLDVDVDGDIRSEIDRYLEEWRLPSAPTTSREQNVTLDKDTIGSKLMSLAGDLEIAHHSLAVVAIMATLAIQPEHVNLDHKREMLTHLARIRKSFRVRAWIADSIMDRLDRDASSAGARWNGRRA